MATHENCMNEVMQKAFEMGGLEDGGYHLEDDELEYLIQLALSQQTEPTDAFTAVDMATAAAQGFRDGQAAVEQATAQDEREIIGVERYRVEPTGRGFWPFCVRAGNGERELFSGHRKTCEQVAAELATAFEDGKFVAARPAQAEQQPCEAEEWRSVDGYEGLYSVSSLGRLRSDRTGKYLSLNSRVASGYVKADMHKDGEKKQTTVHRLVAQAFLERPEGADEVNHINGDKLDNRVSNLAWCSRRENVNHGYYELGHLVHRVKAIPIEGNGPELVFASIEQAVANGFHSGGIYTCLGQPHRYHLGYYWRSLKDAAPIAQTSPQPVVDANFIGDAADSLISVITEKGGSSERKGGNADYRGSTGRAVRPTK